MPVLQIKDLLAGLPDFENNQQLRVKTVEWLALQGSQINQDDVFEVQDALRSFLKILQTVSKYLLQVDGLIDSVEQSLKTKYVYWQYTISQKWQDRYVSHIIK